MFHLSIILNPVHQTQMKPRGGTNTEKADSYPAQMFLLKLPAEKYKQTEMGLLDIVKV